MCIYTLGNGSQEGSYESRSENLFKNGACLSYSPIHKEVKVYNNIG